jgi:hypothetical protein
MSTATHLYICKYTNNLTPLVGAAVASIESIQNPVFGVVAISFQDYRQESVYFIFGYIFLDIYVCKHPSLAYEVRCYLV